MMRIRKFIPVWRMEDETSFLTEQLHAGWKLRKVHALAYDFASSADTAGVVVSDYRSIKDTEDYLDFIQESGWELLRAVRFLDGNYLYLYNPDGQAVLYSDPDSRIALLKRVRSRWTMIGGLCLLLQLLGLMPSLIINGPLNGIALAIYPLILIVLALYTYNFVHLTSKIHKLQQNNS